MDKEILNTIINHLEEASFITEDVGEEEYSCFENLPENLKYSSRGDSMEDNYLDLDDITDDINDCIEKLQKMLEWYDRCKELDTSSVIGIYFRDKNGENMLIFDAY